MGRPLQPRTASELFEDQHGSFRLIELTRGQFAKVDEIDVSIINVRRWCAQWDKSTQSYYATCGITGPDGKSHTTLMHRHIMGSPIGRSVDHIDHDTLNNRRYNLRVADEFQSAWNRRVRLDNTTGHKGVTWNSRDRLWYARIGVRNRRIHLGCFVTQDQAIEAYLAAADRAYGEFSCYDAQKR